MPLPFGIHDVHRFFRAESHPEMISYGKAIEFHAAALGLGDKFLDVILKLKVTENCEQCRLFLINGTFSDISLHLQGVVIAYDSAATVTADRFLQGRCTFLFLFRYLLSEFPEIGRGLVPEVLHPLERFLPLWDILHHHLHYLEEVAWLNKKRLPAISDHKNKSKAVELFKKRLW